MQGTQAVKVEVKAEKITKEEQTTVTRENKLPKTPLADVAPAYGRQIGEKRTIDLTMDDDDDDDEVRVLGRRKKRNRALR